MGVDSVFLTDVLRGLIAQTENLSGKRYEGPSSLLAPAFHVIADHLRSLSFAIADGAQPSNTDRGYVLRKLLRRAVRYGRQLGFEKPFLGSVLPRLITLMGDDYPELKSSQNRIAEIMQVEEESFFRTLQRGGVLLSQVIESSKKAGSINGDDAFKLKDTYGLPFEEIALIAKDSHLGIDTDRYKALEDEAKKRSKASSKMHAQEITSDLLQGIEPTQFVGFEQTETESTIKAIIHEGKSVNHLEAGQRAIIILNKTPFYAEKGGQVGDHGFIAAFEVNDTQVSSGIIQHSGLLKEGSLKMGLKVKAEIDLARRKKIQSNHSATHLLHWALGLVLGDHIKQAGSVVDDEHLRFDFNHHKALTADEVEQIEELVNDKIRENASISSYEQSYEDAQKDKGIKQFFGDKYGKVVRVIDIDFSKELCGGTHAKATGEIGYFRIAKESSIASGVRRIEAVTGRRAEDLAKESSKTLIQLSALLKAPEGQLKTKLEQLVEKNKELESEIKQLKMKQLNQIAEELAKQASPIISEVPCTSSDLKLLADLITSKQPGVSLLLGCRDKERATLLAKIDKSLILQGRKAQALILAVAPLVEGSGGGKDDFAQGFGKAPTRLLEALEAGQQWFKS